MNSDLPLKNGFEIMVPFTVDGHRSRPRATAGFGLADGVPDYFRTLQITLLHGRDFGTQDRMDSQKVIIVDEALAQSCWPGRDAFGKVIKLSGAEAFAVVGVVPHIRYMSPGDEAQLSLPI